RNFPDPAEGEHPDGNPWQPETITMMDFANAVKPTLSAGFHSGSEVVNYPWDTWERLHADNDWFIDISQRYAEAARSNSPETYMTDLINGITNGYAWYRITGGKQDYMNYFQQSREVTIEISRDCLPDSPYLYWTYNKNAIMGLIAESLTGLCGRIQCSDDCTAIKAKVEIPDRDCDNSFIFSQEQTGKFCRLLLPGRYNIKISSFYHYPKLIENIDVNSGDFTRLDVSLDHTNRGDISADGIIDIQDVILCLRIAIGLEPIDLQSADINKDTMVDIIDVILILQMSIGLN
ncbi:MAG TPA: M14 family zinc carboxypeptidase, partial [bacterium]|nr:M14 family zinc carboxypeptidase [bacterium]